jgi:hypothetical protein
MLLLLLLLSKAETSSISSHSIADQMYHQRFHFFVSAKRFSRFSKNHCVTFFKFQNSFKIAKFETATIDFQKDFEKMSRSCDNGMAPCDALLP